VAFIGVALLLSLLCVTTTATTSQVGSILLFATIGFTYAATPIFVYYFAHGELGVFFRNYFLVPRAIAMGIHTGGGRSAIRSSQLITARCRSRSGWRSVYECFIGTSLEELEAQAFLETHRGSRIIELPLPNSASHDPTLVYVVLAR
jgi:hypothetical protein